MVAPFQPPGHMAAVSEGSAMAGPNLVVLQSPVMTDEQMETLRKQICVYSTICTQLVEMHKALCQQQPSPLPSYMIGQHLLYDLAGGVPGFRTSARQRWTPSQTQLKILEGLFEQGIATPNKQKIKEITMELSQHGQISETNVYNWFQNRKARAKRKQLPQKEGESEFETDDECPREKKCKAECDSNPDNAESGLCESNALQGNHSTISKPHLADHKQNGIQDNMSSTLLQAEDERKPHVSFGQTMHGVGVNSGNDFIEFLSEVKSLDSSNKFDGLVHGITQTMSSNVADFRRMFGNNAMLMDSHGHMVSTNDMQTTLYSRQLQ